MSFNSTSAISSSYVPLPLFYFLATIFEPTIATSRKFTPLVPCMCLVIFLSAISSAHAAENGTDRLALLALKQSLQDPQMAMNSWNDSFHFCQWKGITCGHLHQRVTRLELDSKGLIGNMSPHIGNLSFLRVLSLYNNNLHGEIPSSLGGLFRLRVLNLHTNSFTGEIPANISRCSSLTFLVVGENKLVGKLPEDLGALSKLKTFVVQQNSLTGGITFLANLSSLRNLSLAYNAFEGSISDSIGQLKYLEFLGLSNNNFSGVIPPSLYNLSSLTVLSVSNNQLKGSLLPNIGLMFPNLQYLQLSHNHLTGTLPPSFSNCSDLVILEAAFNNFFGKIEINFGGMTNFITLVVAANILGSGELDEFNFIASVANCSNFQVLGLEGNKFRGRLPNSLGNLSCQMHFLDLAGNQIFGALPSTIGSLLGLSSLYLDENQFTGTVPSSIGKLEKLQILVFQYNSFSGRIPESIGNLSLLNKLYMRMNRLDGFIPTTIVNCQSLIMLDLSYNNFSGLIPQEICNLSALSVTLDLSHNHLSGHIPVEISNLQNLGSLDLSNNDLSGEIPSSLGSCSSLESLFLQLNVFQGLIPSSLSSLKGILNIDLSYNNLSGQIPRFLGQLSLRYLNLSFNNFEGELPVGGVFANQSAIAVVGNRNLCGGLPQLQLHKCDIKESTKQRGRSRALIIGIPVICTFLSLTVVFLVSFFYWRAKRRGMKSSIPELDEQFLRVSYEQLLKATDGFSAENMLGSGSFGSVYKGILNDNEEVVAVKVLHLQSRGASKSFAAECEALRNVRHRNLVKIITSCSSIDFQGNDFKALVYEFMPNGSLERWLHSIPKAQNDIIELPKLGLLQRMNIAIDVACALDYLHHYCEPPVVHCDLKPSNILLDDDMVGHVGDFGLAKFLLPQLVDAIQSSSTAFRGTIGYAAPEYGFGSAISSNGDVYSFGILLLEMITGKRPTDSIFKDDFNLHSFASTALPENVTDIVDPTIFTDSDEAKSVKVTVCLVSAIKVGVACSMESPQARISIQNAIRDLNSIRNVILQ